MKRLSLLILAMTLFVPRLHAEDSPDARITTASINLSDCSVLRIFARLWKSHPLGDAESATWIAMDQEGQYKQIDWAYTPQRNMTIWTGAIPERIVAQLHTHGESLNPKPSGPDVLVAKRLNIFVYTVTRKGIWKVTPDGAVTQEMERHWFQEVVQRCGID